MNCLNHGSFPEEGTCPVCSGLEMTRTDTHPFVKPTLAEPPKPPKRIRKDNGKRTRRVSVARMQLQARTILAREMDRMMEHSFTRSLTRDEGVSLRGYLELLNELAELDKIEALDKNEKKEK
jgi:hypothetical protein